MNIILYECIPLNYFFGNVDIDFEKEDLKV